MGHKVAPYDIMHIKQYPLRPLLYVPFEKKKLFQNTCHISLFKAIFECFPKEYTLNTSFHIRLYITHVQINQFNAVRLFRVDKETKYSTKFFLRCVIFSKKTCKRGRTEGVFNL